MNTYSIVSWLDWLPSPATRMQQESKWTRGVSSIWWPDWRDSSVGDQIEDRRTTCCDASLIVVRPEKDVYFKLTVTTALFYGLVGSHAKAWSIANYAVTRTDLIAHSLVFLSIPPGIELDFFWLVSQTVTVTLPLLPLWCRNCQTDTCIYAVMHLCFSCILSCYRFFLYFSFI